MEQLSVLFGVKPVSPPFHTKEQKSIASTVSALGDASVSFLKVKNGMRARYPVSEMAVFGSRRVWRGWADGAISATSSVGYYEGVMKLAEVRIHRV
jgi:hypothetical protein